MSVSALGGYAIGTLAVSAIGLILVVWAFARLKLADPEQALAMPKGSVRALVALGTLGLFGAFAIYLFSSLNQLDRNVKVIDGGTLAGIKLLDSTLLAAERKHGNGTQVELIDVGSVRDSIDIAKQVVTAIVSILASIVGFYFGSRIAFQSAAPASPLGSGSTSLGDSLGGAVTKLRQVVARAGEIARQAQALLTAIPPEAKVVAQGDLRTISTAADRAKSYLETLRVQRQSLEASTGVGDQGAAGRSLPKAQSLVIAAQKELARAEAAYKRLVAYTEA